LSFQSASVYGEEVTLRSLAVQPTLLARADRSAATKGRPLYWSMIQGFIFGFFSQFNILIGGNGEGAIATGGYGYRATDLLCLAAVVLLGFRVLVPRRLIALTFFVALIGICCVIRVVAQDFWADPRTVILGIHYVGYSFAALYVAIILDQESARDGFCWGLVCGVVATVPIFVLQASGMMSALVDYGLVPGYYEILHVDFGDVLRYSGLWGHPNEASHIAALAAPGATYLYFVRRRIFPSVIVAAALLIVFFYTQSRGGFLVGGGVLALPLFFGPGGKINIPRLLLASAILSIGAMSLSHLSFLSSRFDDAGTSGNFAERLNTILNGVEALLGHPFGLSLDDFYSTMAALTGGVPSVHNGFLFFGLIFGWLPLVVLVAAITRTLFIHSDADALFAFMSLGLIFSSMFEEVPSSYSFAFVICMIIGRSFTTTRLGSELLDKTRVQARQFTSRAAWQSRRLARS
jgi:hypothetical protein